MKWKIALFLFIILFIVPLLGIHYKVNYVVKNFIPADQYKKIQNILNEPINLPSVYFQTTSIPSIMKEQSQKNVANYQTYSVKTVDPQLFNQLIEGKSFTATDWMRVKAEIQRIRPWLNELKTLTEESDSVFPAMVEASKGSAKNVNFYHLYMCGDLLCLSAWAEAHDLQWIKAFNANLAAFRLTQRPLYMILSAHLIASGIQVKAAKTMAYLADQCMETPALQNCLLKMNQLESKILLDSITDPFWQDVIAIIKELPENKNLQQRRSKRYYFRLWTDYLYKYELDSEWESYLGIGRLLGVGKQIDAIVYKVGVPNFESSKVKEDEAIALTRLSRLRLAKRLVQLNDNGQNRSMEDAISKYIKTEPIDPFEDNSKSFLYSQAQKLYYSIGPDRRNDYANIVYNPSNGIESRGDIFLPVYANSSP